MSTEPFIGIQVDPPSREGDLHELCAKLKRLATVNQLVCFYREPDVRWSEAPFAGKPLQPQATVLDEGGQTAIERLNEAAQAEGQRIFLGGGEWYTHPGGVPEAWKPYVQIDCFGKPTYLTCVNQPDWREFHINMHRDLIAQNPYLAGFMFMHERSGPMQQLLKPEIWQGEYNPGCFCEHCKELAAQQGLDGDRAAAGMRELVKLFRDKAVPAAQRDGVFTQFWRILSRHSDLMGWEGFMWESLQRFRSDIADAIRAARDGVTVGYHFQNCSHFGNLPWRAGDDPERIKEFADWTKPSIYPGVSGLRYRNTIRLGRETFLGDFSQEVAHQALSSWFGRSADCGREALTEDAIAENRQVAFDAKWCEIETRRIVDGAAPKPCYAGLGIGVPGGEQADNPALLAECAHACIDGGATGFVISRHTSEMPDDQLQAVGDVIRERMF